MIITRRAFIAGIGAATAGFALGIDRLARAAGGTQVFAPNPFIQIGSDGSIAIVCHRSEMGQGIRSSLPVLVADELGADPARVEIVQGDGDAKYGDQDTDGSASVRGPWDEMRRVAATARAMLTTAAAKRWGVPEAKLVARDGAIHDGDRALSFGELAVDASKLPVPKHATPRPVKDYPHVGKPMPQRDAPDVVTGRARYAADVVLPNMLTAVIARPPVLLGSVAKLDAKRALAIPGVVQVVEVPKPKLPIVMQQLGGVAVLADNTWAAMRGRAALDITWDAGPNGAHESDAYTKELQAAVRAPGQSVRKVGNADAALAKAAKRVEAEYIVPYLAHAAMEPPAAVARVDGKTAEVWACTQNPQGVREDVAKALGFKVVDVTVHVTLLGGGFGRKSFSDFSIEAAWLANAAHRPVRVQWTRDDDIRHSTYHTHSVQALAAGLDGAGKVVAWRHRIAYPPIGSTFDAKNDHAGSNELGMGATDLPLAVPNVTVEVGKAPAHMRIGWLRSVCNIQQAFAVGAFVDELAHETKRDPRDMLVELVGPARVLTAASLGIKELKNNYGNSLARTPYDVARLHRVIERVSEMAKWDEARKAGRAIGMHAHASFATWVAVACEVEKGPHGELRVAEAWLAADCGQVLNPDRVKMQMEGSFVFAMSNALHGKITVKDGAVVERNFHDYRLLRMPEAPRAIHVELIDSEAFPGGAGEPGVPPVAPAIANAWFALTGVRLRNFPFLR